jgi:hypothetical protein
VLESFISWTQRCSQHWCMSGIMRRMQKRWNEGSLLEWSGRYHQGIELLLEMVQQSVGGNKAWASQG